MYGISLHTAVFHPDSDCADCSLSLSALFWSHRVTQTEPGRQKSHDNPLQTCSQRPTQMAVLSAWQASWDPSDPHRAVGLNPLSTQQHTSLNWHICVFFFFISAHRLRKDLKESNYLQSQRQYYNNNNIKRTVIESTLYPKSGHYFLCICFCCFFLFLFFKVPKSPHSSSCNGWVKWMILNSFLVTVPHPIPYFDRVTWLSWSLVMRQLWSNLRAEYEF